MAAVIDREMKRIDLLPDYYLLHEYFADTNVPFYLHEVVAQAASHGLQYLADTELEIMFSANLPASAAKSLPPGNDFIRTQQYMDFICNRRFRSTLLCHNSCTLNLRIAADVLREGWLLARFDYPPGFEHHRLDSGQPLQFRARLSNLPMTTSDPILLALLQVFMQQDGEAMCIADVTTRVRDKLKGVQHGVSEESLEPTLCLHALRYVFTRGILFYLEKPPIVSRVSQKPMVSTLVRYQSQRQDWITNQVLEDFVQVPPFDRMLMRYADGTLTLDALTQAMLPHVESGELVLNEKNIAMKDRDALKRLVRTLITQSLQRFAEIGLLVE